MRHLQEVTAAQRKWAGVARRAVRAGAEPEGVLRTGARGLKPTSHTGRPTPHAHEERPRRVTVPCPPAVRSRSLCAPAGTRPPGAAPWPLGVGLAPASGTAPPWPTASGGAAARGAAPPRPPSAGGPVRGPCLFARTGRGRRGCARVWSMRKVSAARWPPPRAGCPWGPSPVWNDWRRGRWEGWCDARPAPFLPVQVVGPPGRTVRKVVRISSVRAAGCSRAAKCPPRSSRP